MIPEQLAIVFTITLLGVLVVSVLGNIMASVRMISISDKDPCPPHSYSYMETNDGEHLQCIDCNFVPGVDF